MMEHVLRSIHCRTERHRERQGYSCDSKCCCSSVTVSTSRDGCQCTVERRHQIADFNVYDDFKGGRIELQTYIEKTCGLRVSTTYLEKGKSYVDTLSIIDCMWLYRTRMFDYVHADVLLPGINKKTKTTYNVSWMVEDEQALDVGPHNTLEHRRYHNGKVCIEQSNYEGTRRLVKQEKGDSLSPFLTPNTHTSVCPGFVLFDHLYLGDPCILCAHGWG
jgi:hypothetical protein